MIAAWILDRIDAPLWLAIVTLCVFVLLGITWPWVAATRQRQKWVGVGVATYVLLIISVLLFVPRPTSQTTGVSSRTDNGAEPYKFIPDTQLGQMAIEEASKIEKDLRLCDGSPQPDDGISTNPVVAREWLFGKMFKEVDLPQVFNLRDEIVRRLGPGARNNGADLILDSAKTDPEHMLCVDGFLARDYLKELGTKILSK